MRIYVTIFCNLIVLIHILCHHHLHSQRVCPGRFVIHSEFLCSLRINGRVFKILCYGDNPETANWANEFRSPIYAYRIRYEETNGTSNSSILPYVNLKFLKFPESFNNDSNFYTCRNAVKDIFREELLSTSLCNTNPDCLLLAQLAIVERHIQYLEINRNLQLQLDSPIFAQFPNLTVLSITENEHVVVYNDSFSALPLLQKLSLKRNNISFLPDNVFYSLVNLEELDISHNSLSKISNVLLGPLVSLRKLNIGFNEIQEIGRDVFSSLHSLTDFSMAFNKFKTLPKNLFQAHIDISYIDISGNELRLLPKGFFSNHTNLNIVNISHCHLSALTNDSFSYSRNILVIDISHNELRALPENTFFHQVKLEELDLSHNKLVWLGERTLRANKEIKKLMLGNNKLHSLSKSTFSHIKSIRVLDLSQNQLQILTDKFLEDMDNVYSLDASHNEITQVELGLYNEVRIENVNFSMNRIAKMDIRWERLTVLENADFNFNRLTSLTLPPCTQNMKPKTVFSFKNNNISKVLLPGMIDAHNGFPLFATCFLNSEPKNSILLANNPFNCDCELFHFHEYFTNQLPTIKTFHEFPDRKEWVCQKPDVLQNCHVGSLKKDQFICPFENDCPYPCNCGKRARDGLVIMNCTSRNLGIIPMPPPTNVSVLYFENNQLTTLQSLNTKPWENLTELHVDNNLVEIIKSDHLPKSLKLLYVSENRLKDISSSFRDYVAQRKQIRLKLGNNKRNCSCSLLSLKNWLSKYALNVIDLSNVTCEVQEKGENREISLHKIPEKVLCVRDVASLNVNIISGIVASSVFVIALLFTALAYSRNRDTIRAFLYGTSIFRCFFNNKEEDENKIFDAFIAYSSKDREVVMQLMEELENTPPFFRLCIHERDWIPGDYISENIVRSVQNCRRTVLILSEDFVASTWFAVEVRAVLFQMLQDKTNRLLVVVVGKLPSMETIEKDIRQVLLRRTYLEWGERWFWQKLRYALPHKREENWRRNSKKDFQMKNLVEREVSAMFSSAASNSVNEEEETEIA